MSKQLPKATLSTFSDIQKDNARPRRKTPAPAVQAPEPETRPDAAALPPGAVALAPAPALPPARAPISDPDQVLRQMRANLIVERYTTYAALGGCLPVPIIDTLSVGLVVYNMVKGLADHYQVPFEHDRVKAAVAAVAGGIVSPSVGNLASHLLGRLVPGGWLISTAAASAAAAAYTHYMGEAFIAHFESGGSLIDLDVSRLSAQIRAKLGAPKGAHA